MFSGYISEAPVHTIWLTGLSGSGKTTIANEFKGQYLILDGDNIRKGLCSDLGFSEKDRKENMRRLRELCKLLNGNGICIITAFISPFEEERNLAQEYIDNCYIVYCKSDLKTCELRDVKGLYKKARDGKIPNFTGIDSPYEIPSRCHISINTQEESVRESVIMLRTFIAEQL